MFIERAAASPFPPRPFIHEDDGCASLLMHFRFSGGRP